MNDLRKREASIGDDSMLRLNAGTGVDREWGMMGYAGCLTICTGKEGLARWSLDVHSLEAGASRIERSCA